MALSGATGLSILLVLQMCGRSGEGWSMVQYWSVKQHREQALVSAGAGTGVGLCILDTVPGGRVLTRYLTGSRTLPWVSLN